MEESRCRAMISQSEQNKQYEKVLFNYKNGKATHQVRKENDIAQLNAKFSPQSMIKRTNTTW